eukprot:scaffold29556_cov61-Attheya_sp.AAC.1
MALLALGSDQVAKLRSAIQEFGSVKYFHLDEYRDRPTNMATILRCIETLPVHTTATIFLFCLPQTIQHDNSDSTTPILGGGMTNISVEDDPCTGIIGGSSRDTTEE